MKFINPLLKLLLLVVVITTISAIIFWNFQKPTYDGEIVLDNVKEPVAVFFDKIGVPHIYAKNQEDAYTTLGYVHAQDRLWQMELMRRIAPGRLSEILGKDLIETDKFFLALGIEDAAKKTILKTDRNTQSYKLSQAYLNGINQFIDNGTTPIEFSLVGVKKEHYTMKDIYNVFGYMSFSFAMAHKTDPLLSKLKAKLGQAYIDELLHDVDPKTSKIPIYNIETGVESNYISKMESLLKKLPIPPFIGSNSWVVGGAKTTSGKVIFANDPHISYSQPSVWYQSHIVCPDYELYGFNLALTPFPLLGHNRNMAYGLTMFENDDIDFYAEDTDLNNPNHYKVGESYKTYSSSSKTIKVKDEDDVVYVVKTSMHGPIMNEFIGFEKNKKAIAMDWIYTKFNNQMVESLYEISHSKSLNNFKNGVSKIIAPGLNVMYGDSDNNIAWFASGKLYTHNNGVDTHFILDGSNEADDKLTYIDFKDNPKSINPPWNYVHSANNQPDMILDSLLYPGYYIAEDRSKRITDVLSDLDNITTDDMKDLITDVTSSKATSLIKIIIANIDAEKLNTNEKEAINILTNWKGDFKLKHVAPTIYTKFEYLFLKNVFQDELGKEDFETFNNIHLIKHQYNKQMESDFSIWNDDVSTKGIKENKQQIIAKSFKETITQLENQLGSTLNQWTWNKVISLEHNHPIGSKVNLLRNFFNVGPFPVDGTNEVINNQLFEPNDEGVYKVTGGPSTRRVIDFNNIDNSFAILPTGQSGNPFSKHYKDQAEKFVKGEFVKMLLNKDLIQRSEDKLIIIPK